MAGVFCGRCGERGLPGERFCTSCGEARSHGAGSIPAPGAEGSGELAGLQGAVRLLALGRFAEAKDALEALCHRKPDWAVARAYLGIVYLRTARVAEARAELEEAVRLAPESFICRLKYGEFLGRLGFYDQALLQMDAALAWPAPDEPSRIAALELRQFCKDKGKGLFYRQTAFPKLRLPKPWARTSRAIAQPVTYGEG